MTLYTISVHVVKFNKQLVIHPLIVEIHFVVILSFGQLSDIFQIIRSPTHSVTQDKNTNRNIF